MKFIRNTYVIKFLLVSLIFFLDRISKIFVLNFFENDQSQELILSSFFSIYLIWNEGIAFGLLNFDNQTFYNIITLSIIFISIIILFFALKTKTYKAYFFVIIFGGALGNLYDRIIFLAVPDFIDLHVGNYHWFIFNVADIFISLGIICLIFDELFLNK
jgi:signal peptidase II